MPSRSQFLQDEADHVAAHRGARPLHIHDGELSEEMVDRVLNHSPLGPRRRNHQIGPPFQFAVCRHDGAKEVITPRRQAGSFDSDNVVGDGLDGGFNTLDVGGRFDVYSCAGMSEDQRFKAVDGRVELPI